MSVLRSRSTWLVLSIAVTAALAGAGALGCTPTADISDNTCGNGVLDPGEDCDRADGTCTVDCRVKCDLAAAGGSDATCADALSIDGTCCPPSFACGADDVCHAPSGTFAPSGVIQPFDVDELTVADLDRDGIADIMGVSSSAVLTRYGAGDAPLSSLDTEIAPFANGVVAFGDVNGDLVPDVVIPTQGGLYTLETTSGTPAPVEYPANTLPSTVHVRLSSPNGALGLSLRLDVTAGSYGLSLDGDNPQVPCNDATLIPAASDLVGRTLHAYIDGTEVRVVIAIATATQFKVCIHDMSTPAKSQELVIPTSLGAMGILPASDGEAFLAIVDSLTQCPDLFVPFLDVATAQEMTAVLAGSGSVAGSCTIVLPRAFAIPGIPLTAISVGVGGNAIVQSTGITTIKTATGAHTQVMQSTRNWRYAEAADFDGNGTITDLVTLGSETDVEVFRGPALQWTDVRIPTNGSPYLFTVDDFDADGNGDVAIATLDLTDDRTAQLALAWGGASGPFTAPTPIGEFPEFDGMVSAKLDNLVFQGSGVVQGADLIVANGGDDNIGGNDPAKLTYLYGSGIREFTAPWVHDVTVTSGINVTSPGDGAAALIGRFGSNNTPGVLAVFDRLVGSTTLETSDLVIASHLPDDDLQQDGSARLPSAVASCAHGGFCANQVAFVDLPTASGDVALGLRRDATGSASASDCAGYYAAGTTLAISTLACTALVPAGADNATLADSVHGISSMHALVGDAAADTALVVIDRESPRESRVWTLSAPGGVPALTAPVDLGGEVDTFTGGSDAHCMDATTIELGTRIAAGVTFGADREIVTACLITTGSSVDTVVFARFSNPDPTQPPHYEQLLDLRADVVLKLGAGDFDGDRVEDLVYVTGEAGDGTVHLRLQCDTHATTCGAQGGT